MFQLSVISDLTRITPNLFNLPRHVAIEQELNAKYSNRVIPKLGLVIAVWDILDVEDGRLKPGDGAIFVKVRFRCVVFKPFVGEVLSGWVESCSPEGIKVNMEFFNDIFIPKSFIFENSFYSPEDNAWVWQMDEDNKLYIDVNEKINFRIEEEVFHDIKPKGPDNAAAEAGNDGRSGAKDRDAANGKARGTAADANGSTNGEGEGEYQIKKHSTPPYALVASCQSDGMGCVAWWQ